MIEPDTKMVTDPTCDSKTTKTLSSKPRIEQPQNTLNSGEADSAGKSRPVDVTKRALRTDKEHGHSGHHTDFHIDIFIYIHTHIYNIYIYFFNIEIYKIILR